MAEKTLAHTQERTKDGRMVIPLDHPRSFDYSYNTIAATASASGSLYTACSGKEVYIKQILMTEYSGTDSLIQIADASGDVTPFIPVAQNTCVTYDPRPAVLGPLHPVTNSGLVVFYNTDGAFYGGITLIVQVDPQVDE